MGTWPCKSNSWISNATLKFISSVENQNPQILLLGHNQNLWISKIRHIVHNQLCRVFGSVFWCQTLLFITLGWVLSRTSCSKSECKFLIFHENRYFHYVTKVTLGWVLAKNSSLKVSYETFESLYMILHISFGILKHLLFPPIRLAI